jgi:hypothetical protein
MGDLRGCLASNHQRVRNNSLLYTINVRSDKNPRGDVTSQQPTPIRQWNLSRSLHVGSPPPIVDLIWDTRYHVDTKQRI